MDLGSGGHPDSLVVNITAVNDPDARPEVSLMIIDLLNVCSSRILQVMGIVRQAATVTIIGLVVGIATAAG